MAEHIVEENAIHAFAEPDPHRLRPPNRKRFEDEMEELQLRIKDKEAQLSSCGNSQTSQNVSQQLKALKEERLSAIECRRGVDAELDKIKKTIPEKMKEQTVLESSLSYRSE